MVLDDKSILQLNLISNGTPTSYRSSSYDLTVGAIITPEGEVTNDFSLPPQGVVKVVSAETVVMPSNITGYVHVKTKLCNEGILTLNIGIVDPGFNGPLQSTLINFGRAKHYISKGDVFGRMTFHQQTAAGASMPFKITPDQAVRDAKSHVQTFLAEDFLDFSKTVERAASRSVEKYRGFMLLYVPVLAIVLAGLTMFLNFSNMWRLERYIDVKDKVADVEGQHSLSAQVDALKTEAEALRKQVRALDVSTGVILTHPTGVKVTHLGEDGSFTEAADVDPGASSGDTSHGPKGRRIEGDCAAGGLFA